MALYRPKQLLDGANVGLFFNSPSLPLTIFSVQQVNLFCPHSRWVSLLESIGEGRANGTPLWFGNAFRGRAVVTPQRDGGLCAGVLVMGRDIGVRQRHALVVCLNALVKIQPEANPIILHRQSNYVANVIKLTVTANQINRDG